MLGQDMSGWYGWSIYVMFRQVMSGCVGLGLVSTS